MVNMLTNQDKELSPLARSLQALLQQAEQYYLNTVAAEHEINMQIIHKNEENKDTRGTKVAKNNAREGNRRGSVAMRRSRKKDDSESDNTSGSEDDKENESGKKR